METNNFLITFKRNSRTFYVCEYEGDLGLTWMSTSALSFSKEEGERFIKEKEGFLNGRSGDFDLVPKEGARNF